MRLLSQLPNDAIINDSATTLLQLGVAGVFIIALLVAVIILYRNNIKKDDIILNLQQARVDDAKEITTKLKEPLAQQTELSKRIYDILLTNGERGR